jgi:hypothetical protein
MPKDRGGDSRPAIGGANSYDGPVTIEYAPEIDGEPDPGEIVWAWVPFEEDPSVGKDRPVVVLGRADATRGDFAVLMVSSRDKSGQPEWVGIGAGDWDHEHRASFVRTDRLLAVSPSAVRREGAAMTADQFRSVVTGLG